MIIKKNIIEVNVNKTAAEKDEEAVLSPGDGNVIDQMVETTTIKLAHIKKPKDNLDKMDSN